jgi:Transcriptional regulator PadR-like family
MAKNLERRDLFAGALELMILHSLRVKPMHGYALVKHIKLVSDDLLQIEEGSLYPALQRLLRAGLLGYFGQRSANPNLPADSSRRPAPRTGEIRLRNDVCWNHPCARCE